MFVARETVMDNDSRYVYGCRAGLLVAAAVHWIAVGMVMSSQLDPWSGWEYSRSVRRLAGAVIQALTAG